jgi:hypothetical protein
VFDRLEHGPGERHSNHAELEQRRNCNGAEQVRVGEEA